MTRAEKKQRLRKRHLRLVERTKERRAALMEKLGGKCDLCPETKGLEFDHIMPRTWNCRSKSRWSRIAIYEREAAEGLIRLLCRSCNGGYRPYQQTELAEAIPF